jgi:hypothetical protein
MSDTKLELMPPGFIENLRRASQERWGDPDLARSHGKRTRVSRKPGSRPRRRRKSRRLVYSVVGGYGSRRGG